MTKNVLLTGSAGFIAHHVFEHLMKNTDWNVVGLDRLDTSGNLNRLGEVLEANPEWKKRFRQVWHDLKAPVNELLAKQIGEIDYVLHLAAGTHVDRSIDHPLEFIQDNIIATYHILEYVRENPVDRIIYFSTDEVFGNALGEVKHKEGDPHNPRNPYAATKAGAEDLCRSYFVTYGVPVIITNTMNVIGERQHPEKYVPLVINKILKGEMLQIHSDPTRTQPGWRHYIHARNVADATLFVLQNGKVGESYNIVGEKELDNLQLAKLIEKYVHEWIECNNLLGLPMEAIPLIYELVDFHSSRPGHDLRYALDGTKLKDMGFEYQKNLEESLRKTVFWTLDNKDRWLL